jgi:transcriptional regulator with XRE-family HTH domain
MHWCLIDVAGKGVGMNVLRLKRAEAKLSIKELAFKSGLSTNTIYYLENNYQTAKAETIGQLAEALGCSVQDLESLSNQPILNVRKRYPKLDAA